MYFSVERGVEAVLGSLEGVDFVLFVIRTSEEGVLVIGGLLSMTQTLELDLVVRSNRVGLPVVGAGAGSGSVSLYRSMTWKH